MTNFTRFFHNRWWIVPLGILALTAGHFLALLYRSNPSISLWYPPSGIAITLTLWFGDLGILLTGFTSFLMAPLWGLEGWARCLGFLDAIEPLLFCLLYCRYWQRSQWMKSLQDAIAFIVSSLLANLSIAVIGTLSLVSVGKISRSNLLESILHWWIGNAIGTQTIAPIALLLLTPFLQRWGWLPSKNTRYSFLDIRFWNVIENSKVRDDQPIKPSKYWNLSRHILFESILILLLILGLTISTIFTTNTNHFNLQEISFRLTLIPIIWGSIRFGIVGSIITSTLCILAMLITHLLYYSQDIFLDNSLINQHIIYTTQLSLLIQCIVSLIIGTLITEKEVTQVALAVEKVQLQAYQERGKLTEELIQVNQSLIEANQNLKASNIDKEQLLQREQIAYSQAESLRSQLSLITDTAPILISYIDTEERYQFNNKRYSEWYGLPISEITGKNLKELLGESIYQEIKPFIIRVLSGEKVSYETALPFVDGNIHYFYITYVPDIDNQGEVQGFVAVVNDITERKLVEQKLQETTQTLEALIQSCPLAIIALDLNRKITIWNPTAEEMFGWSKAEIIGHSLPTISEYEQENHLLLFQQTLSGKSLKNVEVKRIKKDGSFININTSIAPLKDDEGNICGGMAIMADITEQKLAEAERLQNEQRFSTLFNGMDDWVIVYHITEDNQPGLFIEVNDQTCQKLGYTRQELLQMSIFNIVESSVVNLNNIFDNLRHKKHQIIESLQRTKDGNLIPVEVNMTLFMFNGIPTIQSICRDISERKLAEQEREDLLLREKEARHQAEMANSSKDQFLAMLSHELRTPMTPILGWIQLLRSRKFDEKTIANALEIIERNANLQTQLIEDLLDISRIISGKINLNIFNVNLAQIINTSLDTVRLSADIKSIAIQTFIDTESCVIAGDSNRIQQIVWNLLTNAIKFTTEKGRIEIRLEKIIKYGLDFSKNEYARIKVKDNGKGIKSEFLPHIFEHFRQADASITRKYGGLGLGLTIAHHLVKLHGGNIYAESAGENQGATFTVELPFTSQAIDNLKKEESILQDSPALLAPNCLNGMRILVIDDETDTQELITTILQKYGSQTKAISAASEVFAALESFSPDILVSDIGMPEEDGYTMMSKLRSVGPEKFRNIPAVALTAYAREEDYQRALSAGFQRHISKPVYPINLVQVILTISPRHHQVTAISLNQATKNNT